MLAHCGERAASLLRSNPDKEALGFFIPSVVGCGPLLKMRGLHASAALGRNRKNAGRPSGSQQYASPEQPVALVARLSQSYGDANYKATGTSTPTLATASNHGTRRPSPTPRTTAARCNNTLPCPPIYTPAASAPTKGHASTPAPRPTETLLPTWRDARPCRYAAGRRASRSLGHR